MFKTLFLILCCVGFSGCGVSEFFTEDNLDTSYDAIPAYSDDTCNPPYVSPKFRKVLSHAYLQYPETQKVVDYGAFEGFKAPYFFLRDDLLYFVAQKRKEDTKVRCELREGPQTWTVASAHALHASVRLFKPKPGIDAYTFVQIHGDHTTYNYPLLRLMWVRNYQGKRDHLWAIVITSAPDARKRYKWVDLGKRTKALTTIDVEIDTSWMSVFVDDKQRLSMDVGYWQSVHNYFKAGIYLHRKEDSGKAAVAFEYLSF